MGYATSRNYLAEVFTRSSIYAAQNNEWDKVYKYQESAIKASPRRDTLYTRHAQTILALANSIAAKENLTEEDKTLIQNLIAQSINVSKVSSENINPLNVRNWETRALVYKNIARAAQNALDWSIASYNIAIQLDPTNPMLRLDIGGMYYAKEDYLSAASQFRQAISLKPNYANAYYNFGQALYRLGDYANAKAALETAKSLVPENSEDYTKVALEISEIEKKLNELNVAGAKDEKPTVEQIQAQSETQKENQEPLNKVGEEKPELTENITEETLPKESAPANQ
jgi:tetratricopeptide (TPR) repeat protein